MDYLQRLVDEVSAWPNVTVHSHRFGGKEFRFGKAEVWHVHPGGTLDIPFPRAVRDALLKDGHAEEHRWVPNSGWTTFHVRGAADVDHALELLRLSYMRYAAKTAADPHEYLKQETGALKLQPELVSLLEKLAPRSA
jgi:hypothetical protein